MSNLNMMPRDLRCEAEVLGAVFYNPKIMGQVVNELKISDFYSRANGIIYKHMCSLFAEGKDINLTLLVNSIGKDNLKDAGGITYITDIITGGLAVNPCPYIKIIKEKSYRRNVIRKFTEVIEKMYDEKTSPYEIIDSAVNDLLSCSCEKSKILRDSELFENTLLEIDKRIKAGGHIPGMETGLAPFDRNVGGFNKGDLNVIAGRPSMGKTLFALNLIDGLAQNGYKTFLCELEMVPEALGMRRLSRSSNVEVEKMRFGKLTDEEILSMFKVCEEMSKRDNIFTDCTPAQGLLNIKAKAKAIKQTYGLDIVVIDHLTLMNIPEKSTRDLAIGEITKGLKAMAKELDICVIILCQLSRAVEQRMDKRPMLSDLRESGNIEQDADMVAFMYRDEYYNRDSDESGILECIIGKQRNGRTGTLKFAYEPDFQKIIPID